VESAKNDEEHGNRNAHVDDGKDNEEQGHDPFDNYGPGILSYFRLIKTLIIAFFFLSMIILPVIFLYYHGHGYNHDLTSSEKVFLQSSLGNLGHARATC
jgi:hypothetical protein